MGQSNVKALLLLLVGLCCWAAFQLMAPIQGYSLGLGSIGFPAPQFLRFSTLYSFLGVAGAVCVAVGFVQLNPNPRNRAFRWFLPSATLAGVAIPVLIRVFLLQGGPLTDDEAVYRFSANLIASGKLTAPSHPMKLFFDHAFIVNDGRMYSQYFLGWPTLMALGIPFGATGYVNAVLSGATVAPLYKLVETTVGDRWARIAVIVFLTSPMIQIAAATEMSHTSALLSLVLAVLFGTMALRDGAPWTHAAFGLCLSIAFFIRPLSAVGIGLPWVLAWAWQELRRKGGARNVLAFMLPTATMASLFLFVNYELTGSALRTAYQTAFHYGVDNGFRFTHVPESRAGAEVMASTGGLASMLRNTATGLVRLNISLFGWPASFFFLPLAIGLRRGSIWWATIGTYVASHVWLHDPGVDSFGPTHWFEMALPVIVLTVMGCERATQWAERISESHQRVPASLLGAFVVASVFLFSPQRLGAVAQIGQMTSRAERAIRDDRVRDAVVFSDRPWVNRCNREAAWPRHFVFWWPPNDPDFQNPVIWANHLSVARDLELMTTFPDRRGYLAIFDGARCRVEFVPLEEADPSAIPNGLMGMRHGKQWRYSDEHPVTGELPSPD